MNTNTQRIDYLDSVRGIAAMMVVIYHFIGWNWPDYTKYHLASMVFNGADAVSFFFVLSGFVLSYKYLHSKREIKMGNYVYKRVLRLYPAFIFTVLVNYLYWNKDALMAGEFASVLKDIFWNNDQQLWQELAMVRGVHKFYIPGWTLGVEMALSLLVPLCIYAARQSIKMIWWLIPVTLIMGSYISIFTLHFALGILLAFYYPKIKEYDFSTSKYWKYRYLMALGVFLLFSIRHIRKIFPFGSTFESIIGYFKIDIFHFTGFASALILLFIMNNKPSQRFLTKSVWMYLGKISYSVYLAHWLIVAHIMKYWEFNVGLFSNYYLGFISLLAITITLTIICATIMYYMIEKPFINLAKKYPLFT